MLNTKWHKFFTGPLIGCLLLALMPVPLVQAQVALPIFKGPGVMMTLSNVYQPVMLSGLVIDPQHPFDLDFIVDPGDTQLENDAFSQEAQRLIRFFLTALTVPEKEQWVNLSPYESDRIIPQQLGFTEFGRQMLAQDYLLKQLTASLMNPDEKSGQVFWDQVRKQIQERYGETDIPADTFNKVWIVPDSARIVEQGQKVFIVDNHLRVMLEEDYQALRQAGQAHKVNGLPMESRIPGSFENMAPVYGRAEVVSEIVREVIIPELEREVNQGAHFAPLRQLFNSMLLATWFKVTLRESILGQGYANQNKISGTGEQDPSYPQRIYEQYLNAYTDGVVDMIREEYDPVRQQIIPRKYFSGGVHNSYAMLSADSPDGSPAMLSDVVQRVSPAMLGGLQRAWRIVSVTFTGVTAAAVLNAGVAVADPGVGQAIELPSAPVQEIARQASNSVQAIVENVSAPIDENTGQPHQGFMPWVDFKSYIPGIDGEKILREIADIMNQSSGVRWLSKLAYLNIDTVIVFVKDDEGRLRVAEVYVVAQGEDGLTVRREISQSHPEAVEVKVDRDGNVEGDPQSLAGLGRAEEPGLPEPIPESLNVKLDKVEKDIQEARIKLSNFSARIDAVRAGNWQSVDALFMEWNNFWVNLDKLKKEILEIRTGENGSNESVNAKLFAFESDLHEVQQKKLSAERIGYMQFAEDDPVRFIQFARDVHRGDLLEAYQELQTDDFKREIANFDIDVFPTWMRGFVVQDPNWYVERLRNLYLDGSGNVSSEISGLIYNVNNNYPLIRLLSNQAKGEDDFAVFLREELFAIQEHLQQWFLEPGSLGNFGYKEYEKLRIISGNDDSFLHQLFLDEMLNELLDEMYETGIKTDIQYAPSYYLEIAEILLNNDRFQDALDIFQSYIDKNEFNFDSMNEWMRIGQRVYDLTDNPLAQKLAQKIANEMERYSGGILSSNPDILFNRNDTSEVPSEVIVTVGNGFADVPVEPSTPNKLKAKNFVSPISPVTGAQDDNPSNVMSVDQIRLVINILLAFSGMTVLFTFIDQMGWIRRIKKFKKDSDGFVKVLSLLPKKPADPAMNADPVGGIDFDPANLDLIIERNGAGIVSAASQRAVEALLALDGLAPQVIGVRAVNVPQIFGVR